MTKIYIDEFAKGYVTRDLLKQGIEVEVRPSLANVHMNFKSAMKADLVSIPQDPELHDGLIKTNVFWSRGNRPTISRERTTFGHGDMADAGVSAAWGVSREEEDEETTQTILIDGSDNDAVDELMDFIT